MSETVTRQRTKRLEGIAPSDWKRKFKEQKLPAWQPIYSSGVVALSFFFLAVFFLVFGTIIVVEDQTVVETVLDYTNCNDCKLANFTESDCTCNLTLSVLEDIPKPVYIQYQLEGFFQNHRRYVISRDDDQLLGDWSKAPAGDCDPYSYHESKIIVPCGAIANSLFNDTFELSTSSDNVVKVLNTGLAWSTDKKSKYKMPSDWKELLQKDGSLYTKPPSWSKELWQLDLENEDNNGLKNEDLIVWMRTSSLSNFRKPWRRIDHSQPGFEDGLPKGEYRLAIQYNYPITAFKAKKAFVVTNVSTYGTLNEFLGISYLLVGCVSMLIAGIFLILKLKGGLKNSAENNTADIPPTMRAH